MLNLSIYNVKLVKEKGARYDLSTKKITCVQNANDIIKEVFFLHELAEESLVLLTVNTKHEVTGLFEVSRGSLNQSVVHPREIFKRAILNNASSIIIAHNHPSGDTTPSQEDLNVTKRIAEAGKLMGIELLDHLIIGDDNYYSLAQSNPDLLR